MKEERFFEYDQVSIDASKIEEYEHPLLGPVTVFKDVVIVREIIQVYKDGKAYKPANELEDSFWTAEGMWAIAIGHPDTAIIMDRDQMQGRTVNVRYSKSLKDIKTKRPNNVGIVADLEVFNNKVAPEVLDDMKNGKRHDVSIGFFFNKDETPGIIAEDGHPLNGMVYDYVQRKMAINHTAFALESGRCPMPFCGVGADEIAMHVAGDPFGGYKNWAECIAKNKNKDDPKAYCGAIKAKTEKKKDMFKTILENMRKEIDTVLTQFSEIEDLKSTEGETIVEETMSDEDLSGLLAFYTLTRENWDTLLDETRITLRSLYTERSKVYKGTDPEKMAGGEMPPADKELTGDEEFNTDCPECEDNEEKVKELAADLSLEDIDIKLKELKTARERLREQVRKLDEELYSEPDAEKNRKKKIRDERGELWDRLDDLYDEIRAYTEAKSIKITQAALADEAEKKEEAGVEDVKGEVVEPKPFVATKSVEELLERQE